MFSGSYLALEKRALVALLWFVVHVVSTMVYFSLPLYVIGRLCYVIMALPIHLYHCSLSLVHEQ